MSNVSPESTVIPVFDKRELDLSLMHGFLQLVEEKPDGNVLQVPREIAELLREFSDLFPEELPVGRCGCIVSSGGWGRNVLFKSFV